MKAGFATFLSWEIEVDERRMAQSFLAAQVLDEVGGEVSERAGGD